MTIEGERRNHFRGRSQAGRRVDIVYRRADGEPTKAGGDESHAVTANIGVGGAFILSETPEAVGSELLVCIRVPGQVHELILEADVRWTRGQTAAMGSGMGLQFEPLEDGALMLLRDYFATLGPRC